MLRLRVVLSLGTLLLTFCSDPMVAQAPKSAAAACAGANCVLYGGPDQRYSTRTDPQNTNLLPGGWIVGEIKTFAFGADNAAFIDHLASTGWIECAGQLISSDEFPEVSALLQETWGSLNKEKTAIYLPDLRGLVLRGWQHGRQAPGKYAFPPYLGDTDQVSRVQPRPDLLDNPSPGIAGPTDPNTGAIILDHVGTMQAEQLHTHNHSYSYVTNSRLLQPAYDSGAQTIEMAVPVAVSAGTGTSGGNETHPSNAYVAHFIYLGRPAQQPPLTEQEKKNGQTVSRTVRAKKPPTHE